MWLISCDFPPGHFSLDFPHFLDCRRLPHPRETNNTYHTHLWATIPRRGRLVLTAMRRLVLVGTLTRSSLFRAFWSALFGFFRIYIIDVNTLNTFRLSSTLTPTKHGTAPRLETSSSVQHPVGFNQHFALTIRFQLSIHIYTHAFAHMIPAYFSPSFHLVPDKFTKYAQFIWYVIYQYIYIYIMHIKYVLYNITCGLLGPCAGMPRASEAVSRCTKARAWVSCGANESNVKAQKSPWHEKCHRCVVATNRNKEVKQKTNNDIIKIYLYI
jgi:hypothetical protein